MKLIVDIKKKLPDFTLDINFALEDNILGLLGASGCGKSMILQCIAGLIKPDAGKIVINNRVLFDSEKGIDIPIKDRRTGFLFQNYALFPHMTVEKNIAFALNSLTKEEAGQIVNEKIQMLQLKGLEKRYPHQLSGGQQQRVALARALAVNPEVLLLDEPFSALDNHLRGQMILEMSQALSHFKGSTIFVTHNMEEAFKLCNNILVIAHGKKAEYSSKESLFKNPSTVTAAQLTGCKNIASVEKRGLNLIEVKAWSCNLKVRLNNIDSASYIGIRSHHIELNNTEGENVFEGWPADIENTPFTVIINLKLHTPPAHKSDYMLQCEIPLEQWEILRSIEPPWKVNLNPDKLLLLREQQPIVK
jgi:ABC-type sulfate/molybdate transport systems ATPase subunit